MHTTYGNDLRAGMTDPSPIDRHLADALSALDSLAVVLVSEGYDQPAAGVARLRTRLVHRVTDGVALTDDRARDLLPLDDHAGEPWPV
jgi:hypothetical protein